MPRTTFTRRSLALAGTAALAVSVLIPAATASANPAQQSQESAALVVFTPNGQVLVRTGDGSIQAEGVYAPAFSQEVDGLGTARFLGFSGPYNVRGSVGDRGGLLNFSGPVGSGSITIQPTSVPQTEVAGSLTVQISS